MCLSPGEVRVRVPLRAQLKFRFFYALTIPFLHTNSHFFYANSHFKNMMRSCFFVWRHHAKKLNNMQRSSTNMQLENLTWYLVGNECFHALLSKIGLPRNCYKSSMALCQTSRKSNTFASPSWDCWLQTEKKDYTRDTRNEPLETAGSRKNTQCTCVSLLRVKAELHY